MYKFSLDPSKMIMSKADATAQIRLGEDEEDVVNEVRNFVYFMCIWFIERASDSLASAITKNSLCLGRTLEQLGRLN